MDWSGLEYSDEPAADEKQEQARADAVYSPSKRFAREYAIVEEQNRDFDRRESRDVAHL